MEELVGSAIAESSNTVESVVVESPNTVYSLVNYKTYDKLVISSIQLATLQELVNPIKLPDSIDLILSGKLDDGLLEKFMEWVAYKVNLSIVKHRSNIKYEYVVLHTPFRCTRGHTIRKEGHHSEYTILKLTPTSLVLELTITEYFNFVNPTRNTLLVKIQYDLDIESFKYSKSFGIDELTISAKLKNKTKLLYSECIACCSRGRPVEFDIANPLKEDNLYKFKIEGKLD